MSRDYPSIVIYGTGTLAEIVLEILNLREIPVVGFLDPDPARHQTQFLSRPILGSELAVFSRAITFDAAVIALDAPAARARVTEMFKSSQVPLFSAVHPHAIISPSARMEAGCVACAGVIIQAGATVGDGVVLHAGAIVERNARVEAFCNLHPAAIVGPQAVLETGAVLGARATVMERRTVGKSSMIGAHSLVLTDLPGHILAYGTPAVVVDSWPERGKL